MKKGLLVFLAVMACTPNKRPEGTDSWDCKDKEDNDLDNLIDCDDDGCSADVACMKSGSGSSSGGDSRETAVQKRIRIVNEARRLGVVLETTFEVKGLVVQNTSSEHEVAWEEAKTYCDQLKLDEHDDWRLPSVEEAVKIVESGGLKGEQSYVMWTSESKGEGLAMVVGISGAVHEIGARSKGQCRARCVRGAVTH